MIKKNSDPFEPRAKPSLEHLDSSEQSLQQHGGNEEIVTLDQTTETVGTWDWNLALNLSVCSAEYFQMYDLEPTEDSVKSDQWVKRLHPEDRKRVLQEIEAALRGDAPYDSKYRVLWRDGSVHHLHSKASVLFNEHRQPIRMIGAQIEIADQEEKVEQSVDAPLCLNELLTNRTLELPEINEALKISERQLRSLFDGIDDAVLVHDREGRILECNDASYRRLGYTKSEFLNLNCSQIDAPEFSKGFSTRVQEQLQHKRLRCEGVHQTKSGERIPIDIVTSVIEFRGEEVILAVIRDISLLKQAEEERKELEQQVQHKQKLESLGVMAGGIAHDFNNLLAGILGNVDLALQNLPENSPDRPLLRNARISAERAAELCNQLLAYSGKGRFTVRPVDLNSLIQEMEELLHVSLSKKVEIKHRLAQDLPAVKADVSQLHQIIMNLISNASDSLGKQGGTIMLSTELIDCTDDFLSTCYFGDGLPEGQYCSIQVEDQGSGISPAVLKKIFDPFFTTKERGHGLGLAAVLGIVRSHSGALRVESQPGVGTTIQIFLPAHSTDVNSVISNRKESTWKGHGTILLADDEPLVREVAHKMLEKSGFNVLATTDGVEAVETFLKHQDEVTCLLLDLSMPRLSGFEALRAIREANPEIRAILTSGYNEQEISLDQEELEITAFLKKPYRLEGLLRTLQGMLES